MLSPANEQGFPLHTTLSRSSGNLLSVSQPTQATDVQDAETLDFDLRLDETLFEHTPKGPFSPSGHGERGGHTGRLEQRWGEDGVKPRCKHGSLRSIPESGSRCGGLRFAPELGPERGSVRSIPEPGSEHGSLHSVPEAGPKRGSIRSILKERPSSDAQLRRASVGSDTSSDLLNSEENSLNTSKSRSVRFIISAADELAADSGFVTGTSTPHTFTSHPSLPHTLTTPTSHTERRASEPECKGHLYLNRRRKSAPGDLVGDSVMSDGVRSEGVRDDEEEVSFESKHFEDGVFLEDEGEREEGGMEGGRETDGCLHYSPIASAGVRGGEEEEEEEGGGQGKLEEVREKEEREGGGEERERGGERKKLKRTPSDITLRKAQLLSAAGNHDNRETEQRNVTSTSVSGVSKLKVSKMRQRFQQAGRREKGGRMEEGGRREGGKKGGGRGRVSKLVLERAELFRERGGEGGRRGKGGGEVGGGGGGKGSKGERGGERGEGRSVVADVVEGGAIETLQEMERGERGGGGGGGGGAIPAPSSPVFERPTLHIPIFSSPFASSPWQPSFLRGQTISPFSFSDDDRDNNESLIEEFLSNEDVSESSSDEDLMAALTPTTGMTAISPIGRSWLSPGRPHTAGIPHLVRGGNITGAREKSPFFNEQYQRQRSQQLSSTSAITAAMTRLSVIPEETASVCGSVNDITRATD